MKDTLIIYQHSRNTKVNTGMISADYEFNLYENGILTIKSENQREDQIASAIILLLSLALGRDIIYDRCLYQDNMIEKEMVKPSNIGQQIIIEAFIQKFIEGCLETYLGFSENEQQIFKVSLTYLNNTRHGYMDDRILRTAQAWELTSDFYYKKTTLPEHLNELKIQLKKTYTEWKTHANFDDKNGTLYSKISRIFTSETLLSKLNNLVESSGLNQSKTNLKLKELKNIRDQVAHHGSMKINGSEAAEILIPAIFSLQLIWLKKLGYTGEINGSKDGWKTQILISEYFNN